MDESFCYNSFATDSVGGFKDLNFTKLFHEISLNLQEILRPTRMVDSGHVYSA